MKLCHHCGVEIVQVPTHRRDQDHPVIEWRHKANESLFGLYLHCRTKLVATPIPPNI